jgi:hypothetical protein
VAVVVLLLSGMAQGEPAETEGSEPEAVKVEVVDSHLDRSTPREPTGLELNRGTWKYDCMECHRSLGAKWHLKKPLMEHRDIELKHGNNRFCLNCHHPENRNAFVDYDGAQIPEADVVLLCAKCHGPQHRDWMVGAHGRRNGYWDLQSGESERLDCINCHDPHDPAFKAMEPLPAPTYPARAAGSLENRKAHGEEVEKHG